jgi:hypothetical protein
MKILLMTTCFLAIGSFTFSQETEKIKVILVIDGQPLPGAKLRVKDTNPPIETNTDENGQAILDLPMDKDFVEITGVTATYIRVKVQRPTDSIHFDLAANKATFYKEKRKVKSKKQRVVCHHC